jgi:hypothetical protein
MMTAYAHAHPPSTSRRLTLEKGEFAIDLGLGVSDDAKDSVTGTGLYVQVHYGITDRIEVGLRDGVDFGLYGEYSRADQYGRLDTTNGEVIPAPGLASHRASPPQGALRLCRFDHRQVRDSRDDGVQLIDTPQD